MVMFILSYWVPHVGLVFMKLVVVDCTMLHLRLLLGYLLNIIMFWSQHYQLLLPYCHCVPQLKLVAKTDIK